MAEYLPLFDAGPEIPSTASATINGGQLAAVTGNGTVGPAGANAVNWVGVNAFDVASGDRCVLHTGGVQRLVASGTVTAGDVVVAAAAGQVVTLAAVTTPTAGDVSGTRAIVGIAMTTATNGNLVEVQMDR